MPQFSPNDRVVDTMHAVGYAVFVSLHALQAFGQRAKDQDAANKLKRKGEFTALSTAQHATCRLGSKADVIAATSAAVCVT